MLTVQVRIVVPQFLCVTGTNTDAVAVAYLGRAFSEMYGFGFYGIEYPGYGVSQVYLRALSY